MNKIASLLVIAVIVTTASASYARCKCVERTDGWHRHKQILLVKTGGPALWTVMEFSYFTAEDRGNALQKCETESTKNYYCRD